MILLMKQTNLSVIIPIYNEAQAIEKVIEELKNCLDRSGISYEIIAVNDASTDATAQILDKIKNIKIESVKNSYLEQDTLLIKVPY